MELQQLKQLMAQLESAIAAQIETDRQRATITGVEVYMDTVYFEIGEHRDRVRDLHRQYREQVIYGK